MLWASETIVPLSHPRHGVSAVRATGSGGGCSAQRPQRVLWSALLRSRDSPRRRRSCSIPVASLKSPTARDSANATSAPRKACLRPHAVIWFAGEDQQGQVQKTMMACPRILGSLGDVAAAVYIEVDVTGAADRE